MKATGSRRKLWIIAGAIALFGCLLVFLVNVPTLINLIREITWGYVLAATAVLLAGYVFLTIRLRYLLPGRPEWPKTFYANSIGFMVHIAMFAPATIARTASVGWLTAVPIPQVSAAVLIERLLEQVMRLSAGILVIILVSAMRASPNITIGGSVLLLIIMFGAIAWVVKHPERVINGMTATLGRLRYLSEERVRNLTSSALQGLENINSARRVAVGLLLSYAAWTCFLIFQYLVLAALPLNLPVQQMWLIAAVVLTIMPPSINVMLVVYHLVVLFLLTSLRLTDSTTAVTYAIILHLIQMVCWIVLGSWSMRQVNLSLSQLVQAVREYTARSQPAAETGDD
jgi:hypothetical protein